MRTHEASAFDVTPLPHPLPQAHDTERVIGDRRSVGGDETNDPDEVGPGSTDEVGPGFTDDPDEVGPGSTDEVGPGLTDDPDEVGSYYSYVLNHNVWGNLPYAQDVIAAREHDLFSRSPPRTFPRPG